MMRCLAHQYIFANASSKVLRLVVLFALWHVHLGVRSRGGFFQLPLEFNHQCLPAGNFRQCAPYGWLARAWAVGCCCGRLVPTPTERSRGPEDWKERGFPGAGLTGHGACSVWRDRFCPVHPRIPRLLLCRSTHLLLSYRGRACCLDFSGPCMASPSISDFQLYQGNCSGTDGIRGIPARSAMDDHSIRRRASARKIVIRNVDSNQARCRHGYSRIGTPSCPSQLPADCR